MTDAIQIVSEWIEFGSEGLSADDRTRNAWHRVEAVVKAAEHHADTAPAGSHHLLREVVKRYRAAPDPTEAPDEAAMLAEGGRDPSWGTTP